MILGIGIEGVEPRRFAAALARHGDRLRRRLFLPGELRYAERRLRGVESLAVRFAAKQAARRALGHLSLRWHDLEVTRERGAPPRLALHGRADQVARRLGVTQVALTLTHDTALCVAQVVLEGTP